MGIQLNGIGYGNGFTSYSAPQIKTVDVDEVKRQDQMREQQEQNGVLSTGVNENPQIAPKVSEVQAKPNASLEDISISFKKKDSLDYLGKNNDIENLDVQKAISDMKKDQVLQQYQFFVGPKDDFYSDSDGKVVAK